VGDNALDSANGASFNTAVGKEACNTCTTGGDNVAIGHNALNGTVTASNNIAIGGPAVGPFADLSFTCFIYSIDGQPTSDIGSTVPVLIDSNNVLGTSASSRRFKHDIKPMDKASEAILALKPVTFKYNSDRTGTTLFGLIAEDVVKVNPNLVAYRDGEVYSVKYDQVNAMLLNEFLKAHKQMQDLQATVAQQQKGMEVLTAQLKEQAAQIQKVSAQLEMSKPATKVVVGNQ
jgi:(2Fe-2S) ferredoxin